MLKWNRRAAKETLGDPYLPALRRIEQDQYTNNNEEKIKILAERFFPGAGQADLQDTSSQSLPPPIEISHTISVKEIKDAIQKLPTGKAPGPDKIPNEAIKAAAEAIATPLAKAATACLQRGELPKCLKATTTVVL